MSVRRVKKKSQDHRGVKTTSEAVSEFVDFGKELVATNERFNSIALQIANMVKNLRGLRLSLVTLGKHPLKIAPQLSVHELGSFLWGSVVVVEASGRAFFHKLLEVGNVGLCLVALRTIPLRFILVGRLQFGGHLVVVGCGERKGKRRRKERGGNG